MGKITSVLLVDDEIMLRHVIQAQLEAMGFAVQAASTGDEAYSLIEQGIEVDLLITDIRMPGSLNGFQLIDLAVKTRPGLKVLAMSGWFGATTALGHPIGRFLQKPFTASSLQREISSVFAA